MDSAAALSDSVMAAFIAAVTRGGFSLRSAAIANGTLIVDHAGPVCQSPSVDGDAPLPSALTAIPTSACSWLCNCAKSAASAVNSFEPEFVGRLAGGVPGETPVRVGDGVGPGADAWGLK